MTIVNKHNFIEFLKKYIWYFIMLNVLLIAMLVTSIITNTNSHIYYLNNQITRNIKEYNDIDLNYICSISQCDKIYDKKNIFIMKKFLRPVKYKPYHFIKLWKNIYLSDYHIIFYNKTADIYIEKPLGKYVYEISRNLLIIFICFWFLTSLVVYRTYKRERKESMIANIGNEAILANKSMIMITENIHHELNTPIDIIENKIEKVHEILKKYVNEQKNRCLVECNVVETPNQRKWDSKIQKLEKDFDYIHLSIEQIVNILSKMSNFKTLKYSNGNKTVYDIIEGAFKIITISYSDINYIIDDKLKKYKMLKEGLKNVDLLNVVINHIKNSIEANSTLIEINILKYQDNGVLKIGITDNGNGIPKEFRKSIFEPNFSTKQIGDSIRGNGMYLNKHIIREFGGNIKILDTSEKGTTIELSFRSQIVKI